MSELKKTIYKGTQALPSFPLTLFPVDRNFWAKDCGLGLAGVVNFCWLTEGDTVSRSGVTAGAITSHLGSIGMYEASFSSDDTLTKFSRNSDTETNNVKFCKLKSRLKRGLILWHILGVIFILKPNYWLAQFW